MANADLAPAGAPLQDGFQLHLAAGMSHHVRRVGVAAKRAVQKALKKAGWSFDDVDLFEINEAFASMCVATIKVAIPPSK